jgi:hypothetical protein
MGGGRICLKTRRDVSFNKVLWNEPTFGLIHLAGQYLKAVSNFFRKFAEICVYLLCQRHWRQKRKILRHNFFSYFVKSLIECTLHLWIEFLLIFNFQVKAS